jgi:acyl-CoA reductase-like NAD-dependent aldehyde dehydrogenase
MIPNRALVHPDVADELIGMLAAKAADIRPGYPDEEGVLLTPVLRNDRFHACLRDALDKGAQLVRGGHGIQIDGTRSSSGMFLEPTVLRVDGLRRAAGIDAVRRETFFPLLPVVVPEPADDELLLAGFIAFVNGNAYGLRNSVWAADGAVIDRFVAEITNGGLLKVNDSHIGFLAGLPTHGGTGLTGGVFGEANYPILRTSHLQGVAISAHPRRPRESVFGAWRALHGTGPSAAARSGRGDH